MAQWFKIRFNILISSFGHPVLLALFLIFQALYFIPFTRIRLFHFLPWPTWAAGWLAVLWFASMEYSVSRKRAFDKTSLNFFKAFLDFLIKQGRHLYDYSEDKDFYSKINDWQHQVIQGIAIGLGPAESEKYFQKMDGRYSMTKAYKQSQDSGSPEHLCRWLDGNLEELEEMRRDLKETKDFEKTDLEAVKTIQQIGGPNP